MVLSSSYFGKEKLKSKIKILLKNALKFTRCCRRSQVYPITHADQRIFFHMHRKTCDDLSSFQHKSKIKILLLEKKSPKIQKIQIQVERIPSFFPWKINTTIAFFLTKRTCKKHACSPPVQNNKKPRDRRERA